MSQVNRKLRKLSVLSFLMAMLVAIGFTPLETALAATTIQVTTTSDNSTGVLVVDGTCTLREAIRTANTDVQYDTCGPSTNGTAVTGPYTINVNIGGGGTIVVAGSQGTDTNIQGDYDLLKPMSIINTSGANVVLTTSSTCGVSSNLPCDRVFDDRNPSGDILIQGFTVDNAGQATPGRLNGGAIRKSTGTGTLFLNRMTVSDSLGIKGGGVVLKILDQGAGFRSLKEDFRLAFVDLTAAGHMDYPHYS